MTEPNYEEGKYDRASLECSRRTISSLGAYRKVKSKNKRNTQKLKIVAHDAKKGNKATMRFGKTGNYSSL